MLSSEARQFCQLVSRAAFCNPFSLQRRELNCEIAGVTGGDPEKVVNRAIGRVRSFLRELGGSPGLDLSRYPESERELLRNVLLFEIFYQFIDAFDDLIIRQLEAGHDSIRVPFAGQALQRIRGCGVTPERSLLYFAFFYQMRRAFYFIHHSLIGQSPAMETLREHLWNNVFTCDSRWYERYLWDRMEDFSTFVLGETGTGKGTAAAAIGRSGFIPYDEKNQRFAESFAQNFIEINLSQYPESLIESELFGHTKGAFTGAVDHHQGVFSLCHRHGAIFLDEIGDAPVPVQIKLLKVLQERSFTAVGSHEKQRFNGRVIAATNKSIQELRAQGAFRDDFFYRLCSDIIVVPPLRQQLQEDPTTLDSLLEHVVRGIIGAPAPELVENVKRTLQRDVGPGYAWPGNVRELEQAVRRVLLARQYRGELVQPAPDADDRLTVEIGDGSPDARQLLADYCARLYRRYGSYEEVARITGLDRRTVKKHIRNLHPR